VPIPRLDSNTLEYHHHHHHYSKSKSVTLLLAVYRQSVCLGVKHLQTHDQRFFPQLNPCDISPYVTSSLTRRWVCLLCKCLAFRQVLLLLTYRTLLITTLHAPCTENTPTPLLPASLSGFPRDRYPANPLSRWLPPSHGRSTDPKRTPLLLCVRLNAFIESLPGNEVFWLHSLVLWTNPLQCLYKHHNMKTYV
jgi:hypothetical protein